jgi:hypothetical protein
MDIKHSLKYDFLEKLSPEDKLILDQCDDYSEGYTGDACGSYWTAFHSYDLALFAKLVREDERRKVKEISIGRL